MPRVHVQKAGKDYPSHNIKKGDTYYWWQFRHSGKIKSKTPPKASQLTQSAYYQAVYGLQETEKPSFDTLEDAVEGIKTGLQEIIDDLDDKISNMEQAFPNGCPSLELCTERKESIESALSDIESINIPSEDDIGEGGTHETKDDAVDATWQEVEDALGNIS